MTNRAAPPARVIVTAAWRPQQERKRAAYEDQRKRWTDAWRRGDHLSRWPTPTPPAAAVYHSRPAAIPL
jgi:hypothetical protein